MLPEENKTIIHRYLEEVWSRNDLNLLDEITAADFVNHIGPPQNRRGIEGWKRTHASVTAVAPDQQVTIEDMIAEGDKVVSRVTWSGTHTGEMRTPLGVIPPSGKRFSTQHIHIFRLADGKIVEHWASRDDLGFFQQIGAISRLDQTGA